ncbi:AraC family transcriptional regulator [Marinicrinis lubricantis]|uniref:AraC family transcriptional regulator n=1 Tax=Marinicrinis lubricantis TaxID=2086470 RepID=A0ABW1ISX1_9BACL
MTFTPIFEDALTHRLYGKSRIPIFILEKHMTRNYPLHHHNFAELSLVVDGTGTEILNGRPHRFKRGTVSFLLPHHMHEIQLEQSPVHKFNCMFDLQLLFTNPLDRSLAHSLLKTGINLPHHYDLNEEQTRYMEQIFQSMSLEFDHERFAKDTILLSRLIEALVYVVRTVHPVQTDYSPAVKFRDPVQELLYYVHLHFQDEITLSHLSDRFNRNPAYISRMFKQHVGQGFTEYLHALRIERAAGLLATSTMSIVNIAFEVGFDHSQTFSRVFKKLKGVSPKLYRAEIHKSAERRA